jgi:gamma-glutamylputrescine oxidase
LPSTTIRTVPIWDDNYQSAFPALATDIRADLCVIGLGATGLCAVLEARALGRSVVGIDATVTAGGAAGANGGILRAGLSKFHHEAVAAFGHARAAELYRLTAAEIDRIAAETPDAVRRTGSLRVAADDAEWADCLAQLAAMREHGIAVEERETELGRGIYVPHDAVVHPIARGRALARIAAERGAQLFEQTPALSFATGEVVARGGRIRCDAIVIAVDGGLERVVPALAGRVRTTRLQMLAAEPATEVSIPCPVSANFGFDYFHQLPDGRIALGGGRNRSFDTEWGAPAEPSDAIQSYLDAVLRDRIRTNAKVTHRWAARVAYTTDGLPVLEEVAAKVWATGAFSGTGNLMGALCGRAAARLALGETSDFHALLHQSISASSAPFSAPSAVPQ